jgi:hypothetical protein
MTMKATVINSEVKKNRVIILLENSGWPYKAVMNGDFSGNIRYMKENTKPGQNVRIEFTEAENGDLLVNEIEFMAA